MSEYSWTFSVEDGVFKNHNLSADVRFDALELTVFGQYVRTEPGFGRQQGEQVNIQRVHRLSEPEDPTLTESDRIPIDVFRRTSRGIIVTEFGRAVKLTNKSRVLSTRDPEDEIQNALTDQMGLSLDTAMSKAFKDTLLRYVPDAATSGTLTTNGIFSGAASVAINISHLAELRDILFDEFHVRFFTDQDYIGIFRTRSIRGIKSDSLYEEWLKYTDPSNKFASEVGRWEGIRLVETNHANALKNVGTAGVLGEGVLFGADPVVMAEAQTPELRMEPPGDFGRFQSLAWYGILQYGSVRGDTANAGEANIIFIGST